VAPASALRLPREDARVAVAPAAAAMPPAEQQAPAASRHAAGSACAVRGTSAWRRLLALRSLCARCCAAVAALVTILVAALCALSYTPGVAAAPPRAAVERRGRSVARSPERHSSGAGVRIAAAAAAQPPRPPKRRSLSLPSRPLSPAKRRALVLREHAAACDLHTAPSGAAALLRRTQSNAHLDAIFTALGAPMAEVGDAARAMSALDAWEAHVARCAAARRL
jgi:hypothetical protein